MREALSRSPVAGTENGPSHWEKKLELPKSLSVIVHQVEDDSRWSGIQHEQVLLSKKGELIGHE